MLAEAKDAEEDKRYGKGRRGDEPGQYKTRWPRVHNSDQERLEAETGYEREREREREMFSAKSAS